MGSSEEVRQWSLQSYQLFSAAGTTYFGWLTRKENMAASFVLDIEILNF
jgi:hypothetical protein